MKKIVTILCACVLLAGCGTSGVSQEEYDKVVSERDGYKEKYESVRDEYAEHLANDDIEAITSGNKNDNSKETEQQSEVTALSDYQELTPFASYSGNGDDVTKSVKVQYSSYAHIKYSGKGHFSVKGHYDDDYDLLVNTTENYDGTTLIMADREYMFEVSANGEWSIDLYKIGTVSTDSFSGDSDFVTPVFLKTSNIYEVKTSGSGHFSIKVWGDEGYDLIVNTTNPNYSGKVMCGKKGEYALFEISASREWSIEPSK